MTLAARNNTWEVIAGACIMWPFLFDAAFTITRRLFRRENIFIAHRSHLYQRLVLTGGTPARVAALYSGLALFAAVVGLLISTIHSVWFLVAAVGVLAVESFGTWRLVRSRELRGSVQAVRAGVNS
jgi:Fuc2NAc and GlcNAc transferase